MFFFDLARISFSLPSFLPRHLMRALHSSAIRSAPLRRSMASRAAETTAAATAATGEASSSSSANARRFYRHSLVSLQPDSKHAAPQLLSRLTSPVAQPLINGESKFIRTASLLFELDGRPRRWDVARSHPSVSELEGSEEERRKRKRTRRTTEEEKTHSFFKKKRKNEKKKRSRSSSTTASARARSWSASSGRRSGPLPWPKPRRKQLKSRKMSLRLLPWKPA